MSSEQLAFEAWAVSHYFAVDLRKTRLTYTDGSTATLGYKDDATALAWAAWLARSRVPNL